MIARLFWLWIENCGYRLAELGRRRREDAAELVVVAIEREYL